MKNPSADQAIQIIVDLVNKTLNTQNAFESAIEKLVAEGTRIRNSADDGSVPLSSNEVRLILQNVSCIIKDLAAVEKGFGVDSSIMPRQQMTYEIEAGAMKQ